MEQVHPSRKTFVKYMKDRLPDHEADALEAHIDKCEECVQTFGAIWGIIAMRSPSTSMQKEFADWVAAGCPPESGEWVNVPDDSVPI